MKNINIAICCVGGGIGQSIIDSCKRSELPLTTFGLDQNPMAYGAYECDHIIQTPPIQSKNYVDKIIALCLAFKIDILIPGVDNEVLLFAQNLTAFKKAGIEVIVSKAPLLSLVRDKALSTEKLSKFVPIFVKSYPSKDSFLKALTSNQIDFPVIAKPFGGSASAGVHILFDKSDLNKVTNQHIIQEIARPHKGDVNRIYFETQIQKRINPQVSEISIQLLASKQGEIIGKMASFNRLKNGVPIEIIPYDDPEIWRQLDKLIPVFKDLGLQGPLNIQGRITDEGLKIFELNARFTGITGLRASMGFNEVEACIKSWLNLKGKDLGLKVNNAVFGIRQITNKIVPIERSRAVQEISDELHKSSAKKPKKLLLTGATGFLGRNLIDALLKLDSPFEISALVRDLDAAKTMLPSVVHIFEMTAFEQGNLSLGRFDILMHLGFARPHKTNEEIAESLCFTGKLFRMAVAQHVGSIINISSQSVYGQDQLPPWHETTAVAPNSTYALAKYSSEILLKELAQQHRHIHTTSLRLASTTGGAAGLINVDLISRFVKKVKNRKSIKVIGGAQHIERIDVRDAISGLIALLHTPSSKWKSTYNLGSGSTIKLLEVAEEIVRIGKSYDPEYLEEIILEEKEALLNFGMDSSQFFTDTEWKPKYSIQKTIHSLFRFEY